MKENEVLKPCPFCGSPPEWLWGKSFKLLCSNEECGAEKGCGYGGNDPGKARRSAIAAWNTRTVEKDQ